MKITIAWLLFFTQVITWAQSSKPSGMQPLYFETDKNGVKVLAQKFEYGLLDAEKIRLGDILIDASTFNFSLQATGGESGYSLRFNWPAGMISEGELSLLNNNGKALWSTYVKKGDYKVIPLKSPMPNLRAELAEYTSAPIDQQTLNELKILPFMSFCVSYREANTKVYLCSRELYISSADKSLSVKDRLSTKRTSKVQINGKDVGLQGTIILNNRNENIFFRATAESSAYLEIDTKMNDVDFKDVIFSPEKDYIFVTTSGAEPILKDSVKKIGPDLWQTQLPVDRPIMYLKGDGGIPMRQEFFIVGNVPNETLRPFVASNSPQRTFSSSVTLDGTFAKSTKIKAVSPKDKVRLLGNNRFKWTIGQLPSGQLSKRYLEVEFQNKKNYVRYDIYRGSPFFLHGSLFYDTPSGVAFAQLQGKWWLEDFISPFSSAIELELNQNLTKKAGAPEYAEYRLSYLYKFTPGSYMEDETWGVGIPLSMISGPGYSSMSPGLKLWGLRKPHSYFPEWIRWYSPYFTFLAGGSGSNKKLKSGMELGSIFYTELKENTFLTYGLRYLNYTFDPSFTEEKGQFGLNIGYAKKF